MVRIKLCTTSSLLVLLYIFTLIQISPCNKGLKGLFWPIPTAQLYSSSSPVTVIPLTEIQKLKDDHSSKPLYIELTDRSPPSYVVTQVTLSLPVPGFKPSSDVILGECYPLDYSGKQWCSYSRHETQDSLSYQLSTLMLCGNNIINPRNR